MLVYTFDWQDDGGYKEIEKENKAKASNVKNKSNLDCGEKTINVTMGKNN